MKFTCELKSAEIFQFEGMFFVFGVVVKHTSSRFKKGDWLRSSFISKIHEDECAVCTQNNIYKLDKISKAIELNDGEFDLTQQGVSPSEILALRDKFRVKH